MSEAASGYTPLFASLTTGTLCGCWPDVGLWPIVLSLSDRNGCVDVTPAYLAKVTGLPIGEVVSCMKRFCEPDPLSRTDAEGGARLTLIDAHRDWGWRVVNKVKYREKARKSAYDAMRAESGENAERMRASRLAIINDAARPATNRDVPLSEQEQEQKQDKDTLVAADAPTGSASGQSTKGKMSKAGAVPAFHQQVIDAYHLLCPDLPAVKVWTAMRRKLLDARVRERCADGKRADEIAYWDEFFERVAASNFLSGSSGTFRADLQWLLHPDNFVKAIEGRYDNRPRDGVRAHAC